jgi:hypothetical protein
MSFLRDLHASVVIFIIMSVRQTNVMPRSTLLGIQEKSGTGSVNPVPGMGLRLLQGENLVVGRDIVAAYVLVFVLARQRTFSQDRAAGWVLSHLNHLPGDFDLRELFLFG